MPLQIFNSNLIYPILYLPEGVHIWHNSWQLFVNYNKGLRSDHRFDLRVEVQGQIYLKSICLMARNINSSFMFWLMVFIFGTIVACGVYITTKVYGHLYDFGDKGQGQMYLNLPSALKTNSTFINPPTRSGEGIIGMPSSIHPFIHTSCISWTL